MTLTDLVLQLSHQQTAGMTIKNVQVLMKENGAQRLLPIKRVIEFKELPNLVVIEVES